EVLDVALKNTSYTYKVIGKQISIFPAPRSATVQGQPSAGLITGKIYDEKNEILPSASVKVVELNKTTIANANGTYNISVAPGVYTLEIRFLSYETQIRKEVKVQSGKTTALDIRLMPDAKQLNQVVVTALGIEKEEKALGYAVQK